MTIGGHGTTPGWYPDPSGQHAWRWWDGYAWTDHASTPAQPPAPFSVPPPMVPAVPVVPLSRPSSPYEEFEQEHRLSPWGKRAFVIHAITLIASFAALWAARSSLHQYFHVIRLQLDNIGNGTQYVVPTLPSWYRAVSGLASLFGVLAIIYQLMWQYRAATTARSLGYPATRSPGLGVGGWFIPVCNLWFPYQALRDCLPPAHPGRRTVLQMWIVYLTVLVLGSAGVLVLLLSSVVVATVLLAIAILAAAAFAWLGAEVVQIIYEEHRHVLDPHEHSGQEAV